MKQRMKLPEIGGIGYAVQHPQDRAGETYFLCSTQHNLERTKEKAIKEGLDCMNDGVEPSDTDELVTEKDLIVWEMRRIQ